MIFPFISDTLFGDAQSLGFSCLQRFPGLGVSGRFSDEPLVLPPASYLCYFIAPYTSLDTVSAQSHMAPLLTWSLWPLSANSPEQRLT